MKIRKCIVALTGCILMGAATIPSMAAEHISSVHVNIIPDEDEDMSPGETVSGMEPYTADGVNYYVDEYEASNSSPAPKKSYTYTIDILPESGYSFSSSTDVDVYGAVDVTIKSRSSSKITIKAKTYPFHVLAGPSNIVIDETKKEATWDKVEYAKSYSVIVYYTNSSGDERETKKKTSKNSIDLSGYLGKYSDIDISVSALKGTSEADKFISNSDYVKSDGSIDEDSSEEEYKFDIPGNSSDNEESSSSGSSSGPSTGSATQRNGWTQSGANWSYINNGKKVTGWLALSSSDWYLFDSNGTMLSGWQQVDGRWYLLNLNHDGTFGKMLTGWQHIGEKWYYLNTFHDGTFGAMYTNCTTPDGYKVGLDGAWTN